MTAPYCAVCGDHVAPEGDHVVIEAERKRTADRNTVDDYMVHTDCYRELAAEWVVPA